MPRPRPILPGQLLVLGGGRRDGRRGAGAHRRDAARVRGLGDRGPPVEEEVPRDEAQADEQEELHRVGHGDEHGEVGRGDVEPKERGGRRLPPDPLLAGGGPLAGEETAEVDEPLDEPLDEEAQAEDAGAAQPKLARGVEGPAAEEEDDAGGGAAARPREARHVHGRPAVAEGARRRGRVRPEALEGAVVVVAARGARAVCRRVPAEGLVHAALRGVHALHPAHLLVGSAGVALQPAPLGPLRVRGRGRHSRGDFSVAEELLEGSAVGRDGASGWHHHPGHHHPVRGRHFDSVRCGGHARKSQPACQARSHHDED